MHKNLASQIPEKTFSEFVKKITNVLGIFANSLDFSEFTNCLVYLQSYVQARHTCSFSVTTISVHVFHNYPSSM